MSVSEKKLMDLPNKDWKVRQAQPRKVPEGLPRVPFLGAIIGSRGSGKTSALITLVKAYDATETWDWIVLFSPTYKNDPKYHLLDDVKAELTVKEDFIPSEFVELKKEIDGRIEDWKRWEEYKKIYARFKKHKGPVDKFDPYELMILYENDFTPPDPEKYKKGAPQCVMIFDDLNYNKDLYSNTSRGPDDFKKFAILHRHKLCSILFLCQTYKAGVPRQLRSNLSLMILFQNKSDQMKKEIAEELSSHVSPEDFVKLWAHACGEQHDFLMIDYDGGRENMFRKNFDTVLSVSGMFSDDKPGTP